MWLVNYLALSRQVKINDFFLNKSNKIWREIIYNYLSEILIVIKHKKLFYIVLNTQDIINVKNKKIQ